LSFARPRELQNRISTAFALTAAAIAGPVPEWDDTHAALLERYKMSLSSKGARAMTYGPSSVTRTISYKVTPPPGTPSTQISEYTMPERNS
jgi:hypothetical protein